MVTQIRGTRFFMFCHTQYYQQKITIISFHFSGMTVHLWLDNPVNIWHQGWVPEKLILYTQTDQFNLARPPQSTNVSELSEHPQQVHHDDGSQCRLWPKQQHKWNMLEKPARQEAGSNVSSESEILYSSQRKLSQQLHASIRKIIECCKIKYEDWNAPS